MEHQPANADPAPRVSTTHESAERVHTVHDHRSTRSHVIPTDVALARKNRMNAELVDLFQRPCPIDTITSVRGIGLYTHVVGVSEFSQSPIDNNLQSKAKLLPTGGPNKVRGRGMFRQPINDEIQQVWTEMSDAVQHEEKILDSSCLSIDDAKKRHKALLLPKFTTRRQLQSQARTIQPVVRQDLDVVMEDGPARQETAANLNSVAKEPSVGKEVTPNGAIHGEAVVMSGADANRRGSASIPTARNTYERNRDPRLAGRR